MPCGDDRISNLQMEAARFSKAMVFYITIQHYSPQDHNLNITLDAVRITTSQNHPPGVKQVPLLIHRNR
jgi:hypothetical protein